MKTRLLTLMASCILATGTVAQNLPVAHPDFNDHDILPYYDSPQQAGTPPAIQTRFNQASSAAQACVDSLQGALTFSFNHLTYDAIIVNPATQSVQMHWLSADHHKPYKNLRAVKETLEKEGAKIQMLTNGGMYLKNNAPQGLYIEAGKEYKSLDTARSGYGNFYMKPNGVFCYFLP